MKHFILITIILFSSLECLGQDFDINGKWIGNDRDQNIGYFQFNTDGFAVLGIQGKKMGGENFLYNGIEASLKYKIDFEKEPVKLVLFLTRNDNKEVIKKLHFIVKIINHNEIKIAINNEDLTQEPSEFTPKNTLHFKRNK